MSISRSCRTAVISRKPTCMSPPDGDQFSSGDRRTPPSAGPRRRRPGCLNQHLAEANRKPMSPLDGDQFSSGDRRTCRRGAINMFRLTMSRHTILSFMCLTITILLFVLNHLKIGHDFQAHLFHCGIWFVIVYILDELMPTKGQYFALHAIVSAGVAYFSLPVVITCFTKPLSHIVAIRADEPGFSFSASLAPYYMLLMLHVVHVVKYTGKLTTIEWVHHLLMMPFALVPALVYADKSVMFFDYLGMFFTSGIEVVTYTLLVCVKHGYMSSLNQKLCHVFVTLCVRAAGMLYLCSLALQYLIMQPEWTTFDLCRYIIPTMLVFWNATYFAYRHIETYVRYRVTAELKRV